MMSKEMDYEIKIAILLVTLGIVATLCIALGTSYIETVSLECKKASLEKNLTPIEIMELCK
jgi:hypothetical protein